MIGELITLPVRIGVRATRLWLRAAEETVTIATSATGRLLGRVAGGAGGSTASSAAPRPADAHSNRRSAPEHRSPRDRDSERQPDSEAAQETSAHVPPTPPPSSPLAAPPPGLDASSEREPVHVSEEPSLVEAFAEPGAEDGAGAEIHIEEPWAEYTEMNAKQIVARLGSATPAELAAVQLYESSHRRRQTVLNAVQRELRTANGRGSGSQQRG